MLPTAPAAAPTINRLMFSVTATCSAGHPTVRVARLPSAACSRAATRGSARPYAQTSQLKATTAPTTLTAPISPLAFAPADPAAPLLLRSTPTDSVIGDRPLRVLLLSCGTTKTRKKYIEC